MKHADRELERLVCFRVGAAGLWRAVSYFVLSAGCAHSLPFTSRFTY